MSDSIEYLLLVGTPEGPSTEEAVRSFARLRSTPDEGRAVQNLLARGARHPLPEPLLVVLASALVERGEPAVASSILQRAASTPALMLRADLLDSAGDRLAALTLVEQVLGRDIDWPGARERRVRWGAAIGRSVPGRSFDAADAPPVAPAAPHTSHGPFLLIREVGRGGSATVYEAQDRDLGRQVALKIYHDPDRDRAKLLHEARVAVALAGDGIVPVFDVDPEHGWLAMQWAPLGTLGGTGTPLDDAAIWVRPLACALARVHAAGWVHHDVKPANVLLRTPVSPMLADFGTARRLGESSPPGSPGFVSPERLAGYPSDPTDDVYAFGRVLVVLWVRSMSSGARADAWQELAAECCGSRSERPRDGGALLRRMDERGVGP